VGDDLDALRDYAGLISEAAAVELTGSISIALVRCEITQLNCCCWRAASASAF